MNPYTLCFVTCQHCDHAAIAKFADTYKEAMSLEQRQICPRILKHDSLLHFDESKGSKIPVGVTLCVVTVPLRYTVNRDPDDVALTHITMHMLNEAFVMTTRTDAWDHDNGFQEKMLERAYGLFVEEMDHAYVARGGSK